MMGLRESVEKWFEWRRGQCDVSDGLSIAEKELVVAVCKKPFTLVVSMMCEMVDGCDDLACSLMQVAPGTYKPSCKVHERSVLRYWGMR